MAEAGGFDAWLREISPESFEEGAFIPTAWLRWLREAFDAEGPLPREELEARGVHEILSAAEVGLSRVLDDAERVGGSRPHLELTHEDGIRVAYASGVSRAEAPPEGISTPDPSEVSVAVADAVLELLDDEQAFPFLCPQHGVDLHPRLKAGRAVWWCSPEHLVAEIGLLSGA